MSTSFDIAAQVTGVASGAIPAYARVTGPVGDSRTFTVAAADDRADAILLSAEGLADGETGLFKLLSGADTNYGIAAGEIAAGAKVYGAADGELNDVQAVGAFAEGVAITAASADGDVIEWRYKPELTAGT
jgi:hypothetical protein